MSGIVIPDATYRLQFTPQFRFGDALQILPYLHKLGISHLYASPVTRARSGSEHGYDVCDYAMINPELGTCDEFEELLLAVKGRKMGWVQDFVPNHMAFSHENTYLVDALENGPASEYATFFDITWNHQHRNLHGRVLAPFLGKPYGQCVVDGDLRLVFEHGGLWAAYWDQRYPLSPESYPMVLGADLEGLPPAPQEDDAGFERLHGLLTTMAGSTGKRHGTSRQSIKATLGSIYESASSLRAYIDDRINAFATGNPAGNSRFDKLMKLQHFRLAFWKVAAEELNYRRFFTVSDLICIRVEHRRVFDKTHAFILDFIDRRLISGLRIDHIDGLFDPATYLRRLRERAPDAYIVVEKILDKNEQLPPDWPVQGTTGYDFLNHVNYLFCDTRSEKRFDRIYARTTGKNEDPGELRLEKKRLIIGKHMAGDIDNLAHLIIGIAGTDLMGRDITLYGLRRALVEVLIHFPVYRTYITSSIFSADDAHYISRSIALSRETQPALVEEFAFIERFLMMKGDIVLQNEFDDAWKRAVMRFQQYTGPLMAKGFEDTLLYVYNRHIGLNEVGGWPMHFGIPANDFHAFIRRRGATHPHSINASATHDTKRGEDTRARLQALSELPVEWSRHVAAWKKYNACHAVEHNGKTLPDSNDEYLLYQTLVGTLPLDGRIDASFIGRINEYMIKAVRESKVHTAWIKPDETYETAVSAFVDSCLDPSRSPLFIDSLRDFTQNVSWFGMLNSLSQIVLKCSLPGVPDFYQGNELWDFSLVDPDNRRPVDYAKRISVLEAASRPSKQLGTITDGAIKETLICACLSARQCNGAIFTHGNFTPLIAKGLFKNNVVGFMRRTNSQSMIVIVPRFASHLVKFRQFPLGRRTWQDTRLPLPRPMIGLTMTNILSGRAITLDHEAMIGDILDAFPCAILISPPSVSAVHPKPARTTT